jgi:ORF6N domain
LADSERSICLITSICAEDGSTRTDYSCMMASTRSVTVDADVIMRNILVIRGQRVLLDSDLATLYQVATKAPTRAVRRNPGRFPADFMFQLAVEESASLKPIWRLKDRARKALEVCTVRFHGTGDRHAVLRLYK